MCMCMWMSGMWIWVHVDGHNISLGCCLTGVRASYDVQRFSEIDLLLTASQSLVIESFLSSIITFSDRTNSVTREQKKE